MKAIWLQDNELSIRDVPVPEPPPGEALIRVNLAGICATDLELVRGYYPYTGVLGHEFVGFVERASGRPELVGRRVVGEINAVCGACERCLRGDGSHCAKRTVLGISDRDGAFATHVTLPFENLHEVPDSVPDELAVFTEPLAAALEIQEQVEVGPGDRVLLIGAGRLGQLIAQSLHRTGCRLLVAARHGNQRRLLEEQSIEWVEPESIPRGDFDIVVEATGSPAGYEAARQLVRPRGTLVLKSTYRGSLEVDFSRIVVDEITLVGSRCGPFDKALEWLQTGKISPLSLIDGRFPLDKGLEAIARAAVPGVMKILVAPWGSRTGGER